MQRKKILLAFGTRPEAIKIAPLALTLKSFTDAEIILASSGQHEKLLDDALEPFGLHEDYDLATMQQAKGLSELTTRILEGYSKLFAEIKPDIVAVHGDTTTALAGALAAYYNRLPIAHVEAGLRTYNKYLSFPEESNRRLIAAIADLHFAPTESARQNLLSEHIPDANIEVTGNTVIDALRWIITNKQDPFTSGHPLSAIVDKPFVLFTAHRRESLGEQHGECFRGLNEAAQKWPEIKFVFPMHPNPLLQKEARQWLTSANIHLVEAQDYFHFVFLMKRALLIMTDSGGIQEEATYLGKPTLVIRVATERVDAVDVGNVKVVGIDKKSIVTEISNLLGDKKLLNNMSQSSLVYGDGKTSERIARRIILHLGTS